MLDISIFKFNFFVENFFFFSIKHYCIDVKGQSGRHTDTNSIVKKNVFFKLFIES